MKFRCEQYPSLIAHDGESPMHFADGEYETSDPAEVALLTGMAPLVQAVLAVERKPAAKAKPKPKPRA